MKKVIIVAILCVIFAFVISMIASILFIVRTANAEQEIKLEMEGNTLIVSEVLEKYPNSTQKIW